MSAGINAFIVLDLLGTAVINQITDQKVSPL